MFVVLTSELLLCCWAETEFELDIPSWTSLWGSSPAGGPGSCQLQANIRSKPHSQWCCCACGNAVPTSWGMWAPETHPDLGLATSQGSGYSWGWSPWPGNLTLHPCQGRFSCFCSSFWAGRCLCAKGWSQLSLCVLSVQWGKGITSQGSVLLEEGVDGRRQVWNPSREAVA